MIPCLRSISSSCIYFAGTGIHTATLFGHRISSLQLQSSALKELPNVPIFLTSEPFQSGDASRACATWTTSAVLSGGIQ